MEINFFGMTSVKIDWKAVAFLSLAPVLIELVKRI